MIRFTARGHANITARHKNTFELTKEEQVSLAGDCIIGVCSDFSVPPGFLGGSRIRLTLSVGESREVVHAVLNKGFSDHKELVVRRSDFVSSRTFAIRADKACIDFSDEFRKKVSDPESVIEVLIEHVKEADA